MKDEDEQSVKERRMIKGMGEEGERKEGKDQNSDANTMTGDKSHFVSTQWSRVGDKETERERVQYKRRDPLHSEP